MGAFTGKLKGRQLEKKYISSQLKSEQDIKQEVGIQRQLPKRQRKQIPGKRGPLTYKNLGENQKEMINPKNRLIESLESQGWVIDPQVIQHYILKNIFQIVQQSPAFSLTLTMIRQATYLIGNPVRLKEERQKLKNNLQVINKSPATEYAIIYADLFSIKFQFLRKIKLKGPDKKSQGAILSLQPIALIYCPLLEEFTANDHPVTNVKFLRRCIWPSLQKLSIKNNSIVDSYEIAKILPTITNVEHIEGIDLAGQYSKYWTEVSWICKMGFKDAEKQFNKLLSDQNYYQKYYNKVLRRVDVSLYQKKSVKNHVKVIRNKFNNPYFDNPISLW